MFSYELTIAVKNSSKFYNLEIQNNVIKAAATTT